MDNRVRELRCEKGLRQEDLAGAINVSQQTISRIENRIENGMNSIPADILIHLSKYFRVSADYILKLSDARVTQECRIEVERKIEKGKEFFLAFEKLSRTNQELIGCLMRQLGEQQK